MIFIRNLIYLKYVYIVILHSGSSKVALRLVLDNFLSVNYVASHTKQKITNKTKTTELVS